MKLFIAAHNIRSAYNVGSIFRVGAHFGIDHLFLSGYTASPPNHKIDKVALGSVELVSYTKTKSLSNAVLKARGFSNNLTVLGLENNFKSNKAIFKINEYKIKNDILLVLGEEVTGINKKLYKYIDEFVYIPQIGNKESLNVSVACGVAVYALSALKMGKSGV